MLGTKFKICSWKCLLCLQDYLNPIVLGDVLSDLLFNQFLHILCITMRLQVEEKALEGDNARQLAMPRSFPI